MVPATSKKRAFAFPPITQRLLFIVGLFVLIVACLVFLTNARMEIQSAVRAYVVGEGRGPKGRRTPSTTSHGMRALTSKTTTNTI